MSYVCQELMTLLPGTAGRQRVFCRTFRSLKAQKLDPELWAAVVVANPLNLNGGIFIHSYRFECCYSDQAARKSKGPGQMPTSHEQTLSFPSYTCLLKYRVTRAHMPYQHRHPLAQFPRLPVFKFHDTRKGRSADSHSWYITAPTSATLPDTIASTHHP